MLGSERLISGWGVDFAKGVKNKTTVVTSC